MPNTTRAAGLIYGPSSHYVDHLAPLCAILEIPLVVTCENIAKQIKQFYPEVKPLLLNPIEAPTICIRSFETFFVCTPKALFNETFFLTQLLEKKTVETIWCPHGNSDKGHTVPYMEGLKEETLSLVYGEKMLDFLREKNAFSSLKRYAQTGNYRKAYYEKYRSFYDPLVEKLLFPALKEENTTVLYAPTWEDAENSSSFTLALPYLVENLPEGYNLIVKPHPNLLTEENKALLTQFTERQNVFLLEEFPPIYPLLTKTAIYIGDMSSIGYDFLSFTRPMLFITPTKKEIRQKLSLFTCGHVIEHTQIESIYPLITKEAGQKFAAEQQYLYGRTFAEKGSISALKEEIETLYKKALA